jgi:hypothetical protein
MSIRNALSAVLACVVSTLVAAWLVGGFMTYAYDKLAPAGQDSLSVASDAWAASSPVEIVRRVQSITVVGHRNLEPGVARSGGYAP